MYVSCYLRKVDLEGIDIVALWQTLRAIGYRVFVGNGLRVEAYCSPFESKEIVKTELRMDIEALLKRFRN